MLLLFFLLLAGCASPAAPNPASAQIDTPLPGQKTTLTVLAAASLIESFTEIGKLFESLHPGVRVAFSFGGSQQLAQQLSQGAQVDVFASASSKYMDAAVQAGRVAASAAQVFAQNRLVVIFPAGNPGGIKTLQDLARPGLKLVLADKSVPIGQYALDFLDKASGSAGFSPDFGANVLKNVVSYEENVKAVVTKISLGEADAGIVYSTDVTVSAASHLGRIAIPDALNVTASYPIAALKDSPNPVLAQALVDLVLSTDGQAILAKSGFIPVQ